MLRVRSVQTIIIRYSVSKPDCESVKNKKGYSISLIQFMS